MSLSTNPVSNYRGEKTKAPWNEVRLRIFLVWPVLCLRIFWQDNRGRLGGWELGEGLVIGPFLHCPHSSPNGYMWPAVPWGVTCLTPGRIWACSLWECEDPDSSTSQEVMLGDFLSLSMFSHPKMILHSQKVFFFLFLFNKDQMGT